MVYGNNRTKKAHSTKRGDQCRQGEILKKNLVKFVDVMAAKAAGFTLCKACYPPDKALG